MTTPRIRFTKAALDGLRAPATGKRVVYIDQQTHGLQLRVTPHGIKTFSVFRRVKGGQPERLTLGQYPAMTIEQARRQAAQINAAIEDRKNPAEVRRAVRGEPTFAELFKQYIERHSRPRKRTWKEDESKFRLYLSQPLGSTKVSAVSRRDIAAIHSAITLAKKPATANRVLALISSVFGWAISAGLAESNPARGVKRNPEKSRDRFLHSHELPRFFTALAAEPNTTLRDFFLLCLLTGARRENVLTMRWQDIQLDRSEWHIPMTKNGLPQVVMLSQPAVALLKRRQTNPATEFVLQSDKRDGHIVEPKRAWERLFDRDEFSQIIMRLELAGQRFEVGDKETLLHALARAKQVAADLRIDLIGARLAPLRVHDLRRTLGSWQAMAGASLAIIGKSLNHKSIQATTIYARLDTNPIRDSVDRATAAILCAAGISDSADQPKIE